MVRVFIDSTTFLYTVDALEPTKGRLAIDWLSALTAGGCGQTNLQTLNEVTNVLTRKVTRFAGIDPFWQVDVFSSFGEQPVTKTTVTEARLIHHRTRYSWWDCLLLASALELDCTHFLSEDMQDGQIVTATSGKGLTIVDPFAHSPAKLLLD